MASRLPTSADAPSLEPSQPPRETVPTAPPSSAKKGKKRAVPVAEVTGAPLARDSSAAAPRPAASKTKKPPPPRPVRKTARSAPSAPPREHLSFASGSGFIVLQECLHTDPDAVPVVGHGQFPPSAPYYIVRIRVGITSLIPRRSANLLLLVRLLRDERFHLLRVARLRRHGDAVHRVRGSEAAVHLFPCLLV